MSGTILKGATLSLLILAGLSVGITGAMSQSNTAQTDETSSGDTEKPSAETTPDSGEKQEEPQPKKTPVGEITAEQLEELDGFLLRPWALLTNDVSRDPSNSAIQQAVNRCVTPANIQRFNPDPTAEHKLPEPKDLRGDIIYYRTAKGIQRFDVKSGRLSLLPEAKKFDQARGRTVWAIVGKTSGYTIRFANTAKRGGRAELMLEDNTLYMSCTPTSAKKPNANN